MGSIQRRSGLVLMDIRRRGGHRYRPREDAESGGKSQPNRIHLKVGNSSLEVNTDTCVAVMPQINVSILTRNGQ